MKEQIVKCGYKHCKCSTELLKDNAIKIGSRYFHPECSVEKNNKEQILNLYKKYYHSTESEMMINKVINQLVNDKNLESEYLVFALCKAIKNKTPLKNIFGLHYVVNNNEYIAEYKSMKIKEEVRNIDVTKAEISQSEIITYKIKNNLNWSDTLFK
jgi:hypothetical protein